MSLPFTGHPAVFPRLSRSTGALVIGLMSLLVGCGGGSDAVGLDDPPPVASGTAALVRVAAQGPGTACPSGGVRVDAGLDLDRSGALSDAEVSSTQYVCNGAAGANGANGSSGAPGAATLVRLRAEPAGSHCTQGGSQVLGGLDLDRDGVLADAEVTTTAYVCNGAPGATGATGATGAVGSAGHDSLIALAVEAAGANCTYGGQRVSSGIDLNGNQVLEAGEVTATAYLCSAAPADTRWVEVTGAAAQGEVNTGYLANASTNVVITLPTAPAIGDWIKVSGVGSGGWTIAQNAGQRITTRGLPGGLELHWTPQALTDNWVAVASSADGLRLLAASTTTLYTSTDGGVSWIARVAGPPWSAVASSSNGLKLVAVANGGSIYTSTDGGLNWVTDGTSRGWSAVASSTDGTHLVAAAYLGQIWTSTDSGATWTPREANRAWRAMTSSADGQVLVAGTNGDRLYVSTDAGVTWTARATTQYWWALAATADGKRLYATVDTGAIWVSNDFGTTWESQAANRTWRGITSSSDGRFVVAATSGGSLYESTDNGVTWRGTGDIGQWIAVASSADGMNLVAGNAGAAIQTGSRRSSTTLGTAGSLSGGQQDALQLQYVGGGVFMPISYVSANLGFVVR
ncbi:WD40/YVTN/BNR-like repeat-containing protein [Roseateles amylovorans]|uniref:DUF7151 domain-containing protein n=1 Tax=Roseateles amylovorans TaxID=2978473 RepID=A0ABY6B2H5_9BURK|nr:hypothetical protein [Roseateles amylovorans]UXH79388.1 hypothetical protein N4261_05515 [Roseateles amylovorans]